MAIEIRDDDVMMMKKLGEITDMKTLLTVATERAFMRTLDGGCSTPVGCNAVFKDGKVILKNVSLSRRTFYIEHFSLCFEGYSSFPLKLLKTLKFMFFR